MKKRVTIKDVANEVGVSVTTVAKAINNQNRISDDTRQLILDAAKRMHYKPNLNARAMTNRAMTIVIIYPLSPREFISYIEEGFQRGAEELADYRLEMKLMSYNTQNSIDQIDEHLKQIAASVIPPNGLIFFASHHESQYIGSLRQLTERGIPLLYLVTESSYPDALGTIRLNTEVAGAMAAEFLQMTVPQGRPVVILVGNKDLKVHSRCIDGFMQLANQTQMRVLGVYETQDDQDVAYHLTNRLLGEWPDLGGIYVSSYNSVGVCQWFEDHDRKSQVRIIGHDLYPQLAKKLENGTLSATLFQNQYEFGRQSLHYLYQYLTGRRTKEDCSKLMIPQLVMRSNLSCYKNYY